MRMRVGTRLWLGDVDAYRVTGTVLDIHWLPKGTPVGYHRIKTRADGYIVVVSGGTAHGVVRFPPERRGIHNEDRDAREAQEVRPGVP